MWLVTDNTIRGKVVASPKSDSWWFLWVRVCACDLFVHQKCFNYALTNFLFGLCRSVWIIDSLVTRPNPHLGAPTCLSTPKVLWAKECIPTPSSTVFPFGFAFEFYKEFEGVSLDVHVAWLYPIQFYVELTLVECPLDLYTSMQIHPYILEEVTLIPSPSLVIWIPFHHLWFFLIP
jgi:hypothetical protein